MSIVHEGFDAHLPVRQVKMAVEERSGLQVVEVVVGDCSQRVERSGPQVPLQPEEEREGDRSTYDRCDGESLTVLVGRGARAHWLHVRDELIGLEQLDIRDGRCHVPQPLTLGAHSLDASS